MNEMQIVWAKAFLYVCICGLTCEFSSILTITLDLTPITNFIHEQNHIKLCHTYKSNYYRTRTHACAYSITETTN